MKGVSHYIIRFPFRSFSLPQFLLPVVPHPSVQADKDAARSEAMGSFPEALFSKEGRIIGIIVSTLSPTLVFSKTKTLPQNVNFAIKADYLLNLVNVSG